jgi:hypothetical protein
MRYLLAALLLVACQAGAPAASSSAGLPVDQAKASPSATPSAGPRVTFGTRTIPVEMADTPESRRQGLSGRASLAQDTGMAIAWPTPTLAKIWMPDMNFPIDVFFVRDEKVIAIYPNAQPCPQSGPCPAFGPNIGVNYVLEAPAGSATRWNLKVGDAIKLLDAGKAQPEDSME